MSFFLYLYIFFFNFLYHPFARKKDDGILPSHDHRPTFKAPVKVRRVRQLRAGDSCEVPFPIIREACARLSLVQLSKRTAFSVLHERLLLMQEIFIHTYSHRDEEEQQEEEEDRLGRFQEIQKERGRKKNDERGKEKDRERKKKFF